MKSKEKDRDTIICYAVSPSLGKSCKMQVSKAKIGETSVQLVTRNTRNSKILTIFSNLMSLADMSAVLLRRKMFGVLR